MLLERLLSREDFPMEKIRWSDLFTTEGREAVQADYSCSKAKHEDKKPATNLTAVVKMLCLKKLHSTSDIQNFMVNCSNSK